MHFLAYLLPAFTNFVCAGMFLITSTRFASGGAPSWVVGMSLGAWALIYFIGSLTAGRITNGGNAARFIIAGCLVMAAAQAGFLIDRGFYSQFVWIVLTGLGQAFYCVPFQLFARALESGRPAVGIARATSFYTLSWSLGFANAPLLFGYCSARTGFSVTLVLMLLCAVIIFLASRVLRKRGISLTGETGTVPEVRKEAAPVRNYAIAGWVIGEAGTFAVSQIRSMWSDLGVHLGFSIADIGLVLLLVSYFQAGTALLLCNSRQWMYKVLPNVLFCLCGIVGMTIFTLSRTYCNFLIGAAVYGIFSGGSYFLLVYHALSHPTRAAANVTVNEILVGIASIAAPLIGGAVAGRFNGNAPFALSTVVLTAAAVVLIGMLRSFRRAEK